MNAGAAFVHKILAALLVLIIPHWRTGIFLPSDSVEEPLRCASNLAIIFRNGRVGVRHIQLYIISFEFIGVKLGM
jgi:hypothetical protein